MQRTDNYAIQAAAARQRFLEYDQQALIRKCALAHDASYLYTRMFGVLYRVNRENGFLEKQAGSHWEDANTHAQTLTVFDLLCDSREDRHLARRYKAMGAFGLMFHQNLLEEQKDPLAQACNRDPAALHRACQDLDGTPFPGCDIGYAIPFFEELTVVLQFWHGDEEFAPRLRWLWDENATQYLRYETMYYALSILKERLQLSFNGQT